MQSCADQGPLLIRVTFTEASDRAVAVQPGTWWALSALPHGSQSNQIGFKILRQAACGMSVQKCVHTTSAYRSGNQAAALAHGRAGAPVLGDRRLLIRAQAISC